MRKLLMLTVLMCLSLLAGAQDFKQYVNQVDEYPFIVISKQDLTLDLVDVFGSSIAHYRCACAMCYGNKQQKGDYKTPEGNFKISQISDSHAWSHDFRDGNGPVRNAFGPWFLRLSVPGFHGIGIHGTHSPESIGTRATEGCIRLKNEDVADLKSRVHVGTPVIILPDPQQPSNS